MTRPALWLDSGDSASREPGTAAGPGEAGVGAGGAPCLAPRPVFPASVTTGPVPALAAAGQKPRLNVSWPLCRHGDAGGKVSYLKLWCCNSVINVVSFQRPPACDRSAKTSPGWRLSPFPASGTFVRRAKHVLFAASTQDREEVRAVCGFVIP